MVKTKRYLQSLDRLNTKYGFDGPEKIADKISIILLAHVKDNGQELLDLDERSLVNSEVTLLKARAKLPDTATLLRGTKAFTDANLRGQAISKSAQEEISRAIRRVIKREGLTTTRGTIRKNLAKKIEQELQEKVFKPRKLGGRGLKAPGKLKNIVRDETRGLANNVRFDYMQEVKERSGKNLLKKWKHNPHLSKENRIKHVRLGRKKAIPSDAYFNVGGTRAQRPHDPVLPLEEKINCNCELIYTFKV